MKYKYGNCFDLESVIIKTLKKSTESTAERHILLYSNRLLCSRFFEKGGFCSRFFHDWE